jgi:hypothetical protein
MACKETVGNWKRILVLGLGIMGCFIFTFSSFVRSQVWRRAYIFLLVVSGKHYKLQTEFLHFARHDCARISGCLFNCFFEI